MKMVKELAQNDLFSQLGVISRIFYKMTLTCVLTKNKTNMF